MIKISLKGLAKYMTSGSSTQRKVLFDYKYPDPEGKAQALYYREAVGAIEAHIRKPSAGALDKAANALLTQAQLVTGAKSTRLKNNARAVSAYQAHFAGKHWTLQPPLRLKMEFLDVRVSVTPDLVVKDGDDTKLVKLEFSSDEPTPEMIRILGQAMFEAARTGGVAIKSTDALVVDVPRGKIHRAARMGARMAKELQASCENISAWWPRI